MAFSQLDEIRLENLDVFCVVGIYPHEKIEPQPVIVNLSLYLDTRRAASQSSLEFTVDYAALSAELRFILENSHFRLLETAADALAHYLLAPAPRGKPRAAIEGIDLQLKKPQALAGPAVASLRIRRSQAEIKPLHSQHPLGEMDVIHENTDCGIYRFILPPHSESPVFCQKAGVASDMVLSPGVFVQGKAVSSGLGCTWPAEFMRQITNPSDHEKTILCVSRPPRAMSQIWEVAPSATKLEPVPREWTKKYYP